MYPPGTDDFFWEFPIYRLRGRGKGSSVLWGVGVIDECGLQENRSWEALLVGRFRGVHVGGQGRLGRRAVRIGQSEGGGQVKPGPEAGQREESHPRDAFALPCVSRGSRATQGRLFFHGLPSNLQRCSSSFDLWLDSLRPFGTLRRRQPRKHQARAAKWNKKLINAMFMKAENARVKRTAPEHLHKAGLL